MFTLKLSGFLVRNLIQLLGAREVFFSSRRFLMRNFFILQINLDLPQQSFHFERFRKSRETFADLNSAESKRVSMTDMDCKVAEAAEGVQ